MNRVEPRKAVLWRDVAPPAETKGFTWERGQLRKIFVSGSLAGRICQASQWGCQPGPGHSCRDTSHAKVAGRPLQLCRLSRRGHRGLHTGRAQTPASVWALPLHSPGVGPCLQPCSRLRELVLAGCPGQASLAALHP